MMLFLLAHVQGLGLRGRQHRGFAEFLLARQSKRAQRSTWFDRLFGEGAPDTTWTDFLDEWSRGRTEVKNQFDSWMRVLPDMYAATQWWRSYAESLRLDRPRGLNRAVLAPASDPDLAGDPDSADVPAMAGAMNRLPWIEEELQYFGVRAQTAQLKSPKSAGYQPSSPLTEVLQRLGYFVERADKTYSSEEVFEWLCNLIGEEHAQFHGLGKVPLELDADDLLA
jgi:hypothetical protein